MTQGWIIVTYFVEISAGVVLSPELVGKIVGEILKIRELRVKIHGLGHKGTQIMDFAEFPSALNEVGLEKSLGRLLQQLDDRLVGSFDWVEQIGGMEPGLCRAEPVQGIAFVGFQMRVMPRVAISV